MSTENLIAEIPDHEKWDQLTNFIRTEKRRLEENFSPHQNHMLRRATFFVLGWAGYRKWPKIWEKASHRWPSTAWPAEKYLQAVVEREQLLLQMSDEEVAKRQRPE